MKFLRKIDGTDNLSAIGGNTTVAVSMAAAKAAAMSYSLPLYNFLGGNFVKEIPYPLGNMMNGGAHAGSNAPDIQEFLSRHDELKELLRKTKKTDSFYLEKNCGLGG